MEAGAMKVKYVEDKDFFLENGCHEHPHLTDGMEYTVIEVMLDDNADWIYMVLDDSCVNDSDEAKPYSSELFDPVLYKCPCCGRRTLQSRNNSEVCETCLWVDEPRAKRSSNQASRSNDGLSLVQYRSKWTEEKKLGIHDSQSNSMAKSYSRFNRSDLKKDRICGCYYCLTIFSPSEIVEWCYESMRGKAVTAICPHCGIDSIIGESSGYPITQKLLKALQKTAFGKVHTLS